MPTNIIQIEDAVHERTILRVQGEMAVEDARLIERIARGLRTETGNAIMIDLADLDLLDSESAPILKRLGDERGFDLIGIEIFLQHVVDEAERL